MHQHLLRNLMAILIMTATAPLAGRLAAAPVYSYHFDGIYEGSSFVAPPSMLNPVQIGDSFHLSFNIDAGTGLVQNIAARFPTRGISINPAGTTAWTAWTISSLYFYRWDIAFPDAPDYTMVFWFRTSRPGVVVPGVPPEIDSTLFNAGRTWGVYRGAPPNGGPSAMSLQLDSSVPEPGTWALLLFGFFALAGGRAITGWRSGLQNRVP